MFIRVKKGEERMADKAVVVEEGSKESRVMVVIDENNESNCCYALKWAFQNLEESVIKSSNPLILFMVLPPATTNGGSNFFSASLGSPRFVSGDSFATSISDKAKSICASHGIHTDTITVVGGGKEAICEGVKKYKINLLVLADQETGKSKKTLLRSVSFSEYCVSNIKCPVLVVKRPK